MTLQSSPDEVTMATRATLEQSNSGEVWGHSGAGDGMEPLFFLGGASSNPCEVN